MSTRGPKALLFLSRMRRGKDRDGLPPPSDAIRWFSIPGFYQLGLNKTGLTASPLLALTAKEALPQVSLGTHSWRRGSGDATSDATIPSPHWVSIGLLLHHPIAMAPGAVWATQKQPNADPMG